MAPPEPISSEEVGESPLEPAECVDPAVAFGVAVAGDDMPGTLEAWGLMSPEEQTTASSDPSTLTHITMAWTFLDALSLLGTMGLDSWAIYCSYGEDALLMLLEDGDQALIGYVTQVPARVTFFFDRAPPAQIVGLFEVLGTSAQEMFDFTGLFGGTLDWPLFLAVLDFVPQSDRQLGLEEIRAQDRWDELLDHLEGGQLAMVQGWLNQDSGDGTGKDLNTRITEALNTAQAQTALARVDAANDPNGRITSRLRELLALGVALPELEGNDLAVEGILTVVQVERAVQALIWMPEREYIRLSLLLEMTGDESRLQQSFQLLAATAARANDFGEGQSNADAAGGIMGALFGSGDLESLEGFSDSIRGMDRATLAEQTSVVQLTAGNTGMIQKFTDSCNIASAQVIRAEADPVEALRMNQGGELGQDALDTPAAREQERGLENHNSQTARPRGMAAITTAVIAACPAAACTAAETTAVTKYLNGTAMTAADNAALATALPKLETSMGAAWPGTDALRMVNEGRGGTVAGLTPGQLVTEANGGMGVDEVTGRALVSTWDGTLWTLFNTPQPHPTIPGATVTRQITAVNMATWGARVTTLLNNAVPTLVSGQDMTFSAYWNGGGGHTMLFTNTRVNAGNREFLIHDPWTGQTAWHRLTALAAGTLPGGQGLICGVQ